MVGKEPEVGRVAKAVAENVERLRTDSNMNYKQASERLQAVANWSINAVGIRRIESGERRVTPDDLVALALAFGVTPIALLMPNEDSPDAKVPFAGATFDLPAGLLWKWLRADRPLPLVQTAAEFYRRALPPWEFAQLEQRWLETAEQTVTELDVSDEVRAILSGEADRGDD